MSQPCVALHLTSVPPQSVKGHPLGLNASGLPGALSSGVLSLVFLPPVKVVPPP